MSAREIVDDRAPRSFASRRVRIVRVGTGFILDRTGLIATNLHVIEGESTIKVKLYKDQGEYQVVSIAVFDRGHDLALMRIKPRGNLLPVVKLGDSSARIGGRSDRRDRQPAGHAGLLGQRWFDSAGPPTLCGAHDPPDQCADLAGRLLRWPAVQSVRRSDRRDHDDRHAGSEHQPRGAGQLPPCRWSSSRPRLSLPNSRRRPKSSHTRTAKARTTSDAGPAGPDNVKIERRVPFHAVNVLDGCSQKDVEDIVQSIGEAIQNGAPLYNKTETPRRASKLCFRIYEGTALKYEKDANCKGVRSAFGDGLLRASSLRFVQREGVGDARHVRRPV